MARQLTRQALTLIAGLVLIGSVVACGGGGSAPIVPSAGGAVGGASAPGPSVSSASGARAAAAAATTFTYTNILPLTFYSAGGVIDFLTTAVTSATILQPLNTGVLTAQQLVLPMNCAAPAGGVATLSADKRSAVAASATPPPTPAPVLTPTNCLIVAYANGGTTAIPVTGNAGYDGNNLVFPAETTGLTYQLGTNYTFYVAIAAASTPAPTATPAPTSVPTATPRPTATPHPTATPCPTPTPKPTPKPTATPGNSGDGSGSWCNGWWHDSHGSKHHGYYYKHRDGSEQSHDDRGCDHNGRHGDEHDDQGAYNHDGHDGHGDSHGGHDGHGDDHGGHGDDGGDNHHG